MQLLLGIATISSSMAEKAATLLGREISLASSGHSATSPDRRGCIVGLLGARGCTHYVVRWTDGRETVLHPRAGLFCEGISDARPGRVVARVDRHVHRQALDAGRRLGRAGKP
jgi:hypothetical protein